MLTRSVQVFLSHLEFTRFEDQLCAGDVGEQKGNRIRDAEAEAGLSPQAHCLCGFHHSVMGNLICPTARAYSTSELASHSQKNNPNNGFTSIRGLGEVFNLTQVAATHAGIVSDIRGDMRAPSNEFLHSISYICYLAARCSYLLFLGKL
jgi:hypothetical protein